MVTTGVDYFAFDTHSDMGMKSILTEFGAEGMGVITIIMQYIYGDKGYYMPWGERERRIILCDTRMSAEKLDLIIESCVREEIFDTEMFRNKGILTSKTIQSRYLLAIKRRKNVPFIREYLLIDIQNANCVLTECIHTAPQSKVKETKENEIKVNNNEKGADAVVAADAKKGMYEEVYGEVNKRAEEQLEKYTGSMDRELIIHVLNLAFIDKKPWRWVTKVLDTHVGDGTRTVVEFEKKADKMSKEAKPRKTAYPEYGSTNNYDIEEMERRALERRVRKVNCKKDEEYAHP